MYCIKNTLIVAWSCKVAVLPPANDIRIMPLSVAV